MDVREIFQILPHRYPFLLVDKITELEPGQRAVGIKNVTVNEPQFTGHWPGNPVMPGVLMLEAMAQVGGIMLLTMLDESEREGTVAMMAGLDRVRFRRPVIPGDQLRIEAVMQKRKGNMGRIYITAHVGDCLACDGEFSFALVGQETARAPREDAPAAAPSVQGEQCNCSDSDA
ncbi:MAG: 3-hydroxyacyl-ACP dehydratase FabZ [Armatimonadetes bacterium]|nr:3-hydroxyacyl-ACP dehydratase FabZ [Armatimonadota bacterium]